MMTTTLNGTLEFRKRGELIGNFIFFYFERFICAKDMQVRSECEDFEVRFCCPTKNEIVSTSTPPLTEPVTIIPPNFTASILTTLPKNIDQLRKLNSSLRQKFVLLLMPPQSIPSKVSKSAFQVILD